MSKNWTREEGNSYGSWKSAKRCPEVVVDRCLCYCCCRYWRRRGCCSERTLLPPPDDVSAIGVVAALDPKQWFPEVSTPKDWWYHHYHYQ